VVTVARVITRDYLIRIIEQVADFVARVVAKKREGNYEAGLRLVDEAYDDLLDMDRELFEIADSATLATLLGPPGKVRAIARLCFEQGDLLRLKGDPINAKLKYKKAVELTLEARRAEPEPDDLELLHRAFVHIDQSVLAARYQSDAWQHDPP
jgi:hypothetical protein